MAKNGPASVLSVCDQTAVCRAQKDARCPRRGHSAQHHARAEPRQDAAQVLIRVFGTSRCDPEPLGSHRDGNLIRIHEDGQGDADHGRVDGEEGFAFLRMAGHAAETDHGGAAEGESAGAPPSRSLARGEPSDERIQRGRHGQGPQNQADLGRGPGVLPCEV